MLRRSTFTLVACCAVFALLISNCAYILGIGGEKTLGEMTVNEFWHVSSSKQRKELKMLTTQEEVDRFRDDFWKTLDPIPETPANELRNVYYERYRYANEHFREGMMIGSRTDRGRIYVLYGPPFDIHRDPVTKYSGKTPPIESVEIWTYNMPAGRKKATTPYFDFDFTRVTFVFADMQGIGLYIQIFSTEDGEVDDSRFIGGSQHEFENLPIETFRQ